MSRIRYIAVLALAAFLMATGITHTSAQTPTASTAVAKADADTVAAWGQWLFSFPTAVSPGADTSGAASGLGQSGSTFFLAPSAVGAGAITRTATIVEGTQVLVPVIEVDCSTAEAAPFNGTDESTLSSCAKTNADAITAGHAKIDGTDVADIASYRLQTSVFSTVLPANNMLNAPAGAASAIIDGAFLTVSDLPVGTHTISFGGTYQSGGAIDITYNITVVAPAVASS